MNPYQMRALKKIRLDLKLGDWKGVCLIKIIHGAIDNFNDILFALHMPNCKLLSLWQ